MYKHSIFRGISDSKMSEKGKFNRYSPDYLGLGKRGELKKTNNNLSSGENSTPLLLHAISSTQNMIHED